MESTPLKLVVYSATLLGYAVILLCGLVLWGHLPDFHPEAFPAFVHSRCLVVFRFFGLLVFVREHQKVIL